MIPHREVTRLVGCAMKEFVIRILSLVCWKNLDFNGEGGAPIGNGERSGK